MPSAKRLTNSNNRDTLAALAAAGLGLYKGCTHDDVPGHQAQTLEWLGPLSS